MQSCQALVKEYGVQAYLSTDGVNIADRGEMHSFLDEAVIHSDLCM